VEADNSAVCVVRRLAIAASVIIAAATAVTNPARTANIIERRLLDRRWTWPASMDPYDRIVDLLVTPVSEECFIQLQHHEEPR
jgi:hypothetical protein